MYNPQLQTFLKVVEMGSFTKAAQSLFISASAVTQQMNLLERELGVLLFHRTKRGAALTSAGQYLAGQAASYIQQGEIIKNTLLRIDGSDKEICIGTSMLEKCRLLYDLWILFYQECDLYDVRMVSIDSNRGQLMEAELVECLQDEAPWQADWEFVKVCDIPMGLAVSKTHPFAPKNLIDVKDLAGHEIVVFDRNKNRETSPLFSCMRNAGAILDFRRDYSGPLIWECSVKNKAMLAPLCWEDILVDLKLIPCNWFFTLPYGFFVKKDASKPTRRFVRFIRDVYSGKANVSAVPVL